MDITKETVKVKEIVEVEREVEKEVYTLTLTRQELADLRSHVWESAVSTRVGGSEERMLAAHKLHQTLNDQVTSLKHDPSWRVS